MISLDSTDIAVLAVILICSILLFWNVFQKPAKRASASVPKQTSSKPSPPNRTNNKKSILSKVESAECDALMIVFYGSQTGTAEDFATRFSKDVNAILGVRSIVCDLEDYDMSELKGWSRNPIGSQKKCLFGFFLATYGEGEPTDNAVDFVSWLSKYKNDNENDEVDLIDVAGAFSTMHYLVFGLGNRTYEQFNAIGRQVDKILRLNGGVRVGPRGEGDDDRSIEEDFLRWVEATMPLVGDFFDCQATNAADKNQPHVPAFNVRIFENGSLSPLSIFMGSHSSQSPRRWQRGEEGQTFQEISNVSAIFDTKHPAYGPVHSNRFLFEGVHDTFTPNHATPALPSIPGKVEIKGREIHITRQCLHLEIDLSASGLTYETGDHIGLWPANSKANVQRLAGLLKISSLEKVIDLIPNPSHPGSSDINRPFPTPCTIRAALTFYLDIQSVLKQHHFEILAKYASDSSEKTQLWNIYTTRDVYVSLIDNQRKSLADILSECKSISLPLSVVLGELIPHTTVRYYSISSSSLESPSSVSITAVVVRYALETSSASKNGGLKHRVAIREGFATSWLQRICEGEFDEAVEMPGDPSILSVPPSYVPFYIRPSSFKLPNDPKVPIVMIGPGTGVAPFRGFVRERMVLAKSGQEVGSTWLFYGCRHQSKDFLYREELTGISEAVMSGQVQLDLRIITAFSRDGPEKVYVQHRLIEYGDQVWDLLQSRGGYLYVCGDAKNMATEVSRALERLASRHLEPGETDGKQWIKRLRQCGRYLEDVWA